MRSRLSSTLLYIFMTGFIVGWWALAFRPPSMSTVSFSAATLESLALKTSALFNELSPLQREALQKALAGNTPLMLELIDQWHQDAQFLVKKGVKGIQTLSDESLFQAHILGSLLLDSSPENLRQLNCKMNLDSLHDDNGQVLRIEDTFQRFLPQSYVAATFLLAIAPPREIIALPKGMRYLPQLYQKDLLARIPANINRTHGEKLSQARPDLAFVAPYSHPPALEALRNQGIQLYTIKHIDNLQEIQTSLLKVGHATNHILEAQFMALFMEASLLAIDNRLHALHDLVDCSNPPLSMLCLLYHQHYMLPTSKCLTGQLIARALQHFPRLSCPIPDSQNEWRLPFEQEKIIRANPDCLVISTPYFKQLEYEVNHQTALHELDAFKSQRIFTIDESIQESPTQYLALAYFDIYQALAAAHCL